MLALTDLDASQDGTPRILDLRLAELLGFTRPREIRDLILRHRHSLERFGEVRGTAPQTTALGGRPGRAYWLNRKQALYLCAKSETPRAAEVTIAMVEVFDQFLGLRDEAKTVKVREHWRRPPSNEPAEPSQPLWFCNVAPATAGWSRVEAVVPTTTAYAIQGAALAAFVTDSRRALTLSA